VNITNVDEPMEIKSIINIMRIFTFLFIAVIPLYRLFNYEKIKRVQTKMFLATHWVCTVLILIGWIFGKIGSANWRLIPIACTSSVVTLMYIAELFEDMKYRRTAVVFVIPLVICAVFSAADIAKLDNNFERSANGEKIKAIEKSGCEYGYATFWNANSTTVLSEGKFKARCVDIGDNGLIKSSYQTQNNWYKDQEGIDRYFLLLHEGEYNDIREKLPKLVDDATETYMYGRYYVLVYDHNLF
ncbi:MAG: hypothetical protein IJ736_04935, partial [Firmicutes bacterium]|nr:hypothetical protein [Bacillota bacterium]